MRHRVPEARRPVKLRGLSAFFRRSPAAFAYNFVMIKIKDRVLWARREGNEWVNSSLGFSLRMMLAAALSLVALCFVLVIVARLDVAFFESNGMSASADVREA